MTNKTSRTKGSQYCMAECKNKARVTAADVVHFMSKLKTFYDRLPVHFDGDEPKLQGLLAYTGEVSADARNAATGFKPRIEFKKF